MKSALPTLHLSDIEAARSRISGGIRLTPCTRLPALPELPGARIWLKRDDLQRTRSFKERGALHALLLLDPHARGRGVIAASAGNHALGLAFHGSRLGVPVRVVMPKEASAVKVARCRGLGAEVILHGADYDAAQDHAVELAAKAGLAFVHPFDDPAVIAGQGTMALEIFEQAPFFDTMFVPVGGGGLVAGVGTALKAVRPGVRIVAVESERAAGFAAARRHGRPVRVPVGKTLADGLAVACVGGTSFALAEPLVDEVVTVTEDEIAAAISILARRAGIVAEGAGAIGLAALLSGRARCGTAVIAIGGGNIDPRVHERVVAEGNSNAPTGAGRGMAA